MGFFAKVKNMISNSLAAKVAAGVATLVLLGGGTVGLAYAGGLTGAKTAVGVALINTFVTDAKELFTDVKEQGGELLVEVSGEELSLDALGIGGGMSFPDTKIRLLARSNPEQEVNATADFLVSDNVLLSANAYVNKEMWQVTVPKLFSTVLTAKHYAEDTVKDFVSDGISNGMMENLNKAYEEYLAGTEIKKGRKEELRINGVKYNCRVYQADLPAENAKGFADAVLSELREQGIELGSAPEFTDTVSFTFHVCKEHMVSINAKWTTKRMENGEAITYPGSFKMIPSRDGQFSLNVAAKGKEWNVKGYLKTAQNEILPLAGKQLDVLAMTEADEAGLKAEISKNITRLMFKWMGLLN